MGSKLNGAVCANVNSCLSFYVAPQQSGSLSMV